MKHVFLTYYAVCHYKAYFQSDAFFYFMLPKDFRSFSRGYKNTKKPIRMDKVFLTDPGSNPTPL
jgi:hypothetical protein